MTLYHRGLIPPGRNIEETLQRYINESEIVVLLLSADYFHSDDIWNAEGLPALRRHEEGSARLVPVLLRPMSLSGTPVAHLQRLPRSAGSVVEFTDADAVWSQIALEIRTLLTDTPTDRIQASRGTMATPDRPTTAPNPSPAQAEPIAGDQPHAERVSETEDAEEGRPLAPLDWRHPGAVVASAVRAIPIVKYAFAATALAAVVTIATRGFGLDRGTAIVGSAIVLAFMLLLLVMAVAARERRLLRTPAVVFTWSFLSMAIGSCGLLLLSFFVHFPRTPRCLFYNECTDPPAPSYRGSLMDSRTGQAIAGAKLILAGTRCITKTDESGVFDFGSCSDSGVARLVSPRIHIALYPNTRGPRNRWNCVDIALLRPPELSDLRFNPEDCERGTLGSAVSPPVIRTANCASDMNCGGGAQCIDGSCVSLPWE